MPGHNLKQTNKQNLTVVTLRVVEWGLRMYSQVWKGSWESKKRNGKEKEDSNHRSSEKRKAQNFEFNSVGYRLTEYSFFMLSLNQDISYSSPPTSPASYTL